MNRGPPRDAYSYSQPPHVSMRAIEEEEDGDDKTGSASASHTASGGASLARPAASMTGFANPSARLDEDDTDEDCSDSTALLS